jgi:hypothetical protein
MAKTTLTKTTKTTKVIYCFEYGILSLCVTCHESNGKIVKDADIIKYLRVNYRKYISCTCGFPFGCLCSDSQECTFSAADFKEIKKEAKKPC